MKFEYQFFCCIVVDVLGLSKLFYKLLEGVVFVMSGFQNFFRGELRDKVIEMGVVYKLDWKKGCIYFM